MEMSAGHQIARRDLVTLSVETIHNPDEPRHYMRIKPVRALARILFQGEVLAESRRALRVLEVGRDIYDPVLYFPPDDVPAKLARVAKRTFCPIKGHASYFDYLSEDGRTLASELAWSYSETLDFSADLKDLIAFDASRVAIEEHPLRDARES